MTRLTVLQSLSPDEQRLFRLYGKLPNKKDLLQNKLKVFFHSPCLLSLLIRVLNKSRALISSLKERKYFDSGDYALSKAGKASDIGVTQIGREHPVPEKIPHSSPPQNGGIGSISLPPPGMPGGPDAGQIGGKSGSPVREGTFLHRETSLQRGQSVDDNDEEEGKKE